MSYPLSPTRRRPSWGRLTAVPLSAALLAGCSWGNSGDNTANGGPQPEPATVEEAPSPPELPDPEATTTTTTPEPAAPPMPPGDYRWCHAWPPVEEAAVAYDREAQRAQAAIEAIAGTITPSDDPDEWLSDPDIAVGALVEYSAASEAAAVAAEDAYRAVVSARDAAHMERSRAYSALNRTRASGDVDGYHAALAVFRAADAAFQAAFAASSDLDIMGELTIGTSGWQAGQFVDWPLGWPNPAAPSGFVSSVAAMCQQ